MQTKPTKDQIAAVMALLGSRKKTMSEAAMEQRKRAALISADARRTNKRKKR